MNGIKGDLPAKYAKNAKGKTIYRDKGDGRDKKGFDRETREKREKETTDGPGVTAGRNHLRHVSFEV
jgi:hypothetical protein